MGTRFLISAFFCILLEVMIGCTFSANIENLQSALPSSPVLPTTPSVTTSEVVKIETQSTGSGQDVQNINLQVGDTRRLYSIARLPDGTYVGEKSVASWSVTAGLGNLTINSDGYSADFSVTTAGSGVLQITVDGKTYSYNITVNPPPDPIVASVSLVPTSPLNFLSVSTDWSRKIAYIGTVESTTCMRAVDFNNINSVSIVRSFGTAEGITNCRSVKLFDSNQKILLSSYGKNKFEIWDVSNASSASWGPLASLAVGEYGKDISQINDLGAGQWEIWAASRYRARKMLFNSGASSLTLSGSACSGASCPGSYLNSITLLGNFLLVQASAGASEPLVWWNSAGLGAADAIPQSAGSFATSSSGWTAHSNAALTKSFLGGTRSSNASFTFVELNSGIPHVTKRFQDDGTNLTVRGAQFTQEGSKEYVYTITDMGRVDKWDVTDIQNPSVVASYQFNVGLTGYYSIEVNESTLMANIVNNHGYFIIFDTTKMNSVAATPYTEF